MSQLDAAPAPARQPLALIVVLLALTLLADAVAQNIAIYNVALSRQALGASATSLGLVQAAAALAVLVAVIVLAVMSESVRRRQIIFATGLALAAAALVLATLASSLIVYGVGRILLAVTAALLPLALALAADGASLRWRASALAPIGAMIPFSNIIAAPAASPALAGYAPYAAAGALIVVAALVALALKDPRGGQPGRPAATSWFGGVEIALLGGGFVHIAATALIGLMQTLGPLRAMALAPPQPMATLLVSSASAIAGIFVGALIADLAGRVHKSAYAIVCAVAALAMGGAMYLAAAPGSAYPALLVQGALFVGALYYGPFFAALTALAPPGRRAIACALGYCATSLGRVFGSILAPFMFGLGGETSVVAPLAFAGAGICAAALFLGAGLAMKRALAERDQASVF